MKDKQGREYLSVASAKPGIEVELDGDFTCHKAGTVQLEMTTRGLAFTCDDGYHTLDGQLNNEGTHYIGIYPVVSQ